MVDALMNLCYQYILVLMQKSDEFFPGAVSHEPWWKDGTAVYHQIFRFLFAPIVWTIVFSSGLMYLLLAEVYGLKPRRLSIVYCNFVNTLEFVCGMSVLFLSTYILTIRYTVAPPLWNAII
jgi:hypothetical protein